MNVVISGPSGVGKGTLIERLKRDFYDIEIEKSISYTTRIPRKKEKNGVDYHFVSMEEFVMLANNNFFFEFVEYDKNFYGIPNVNVHQNSKIEIFDLVASSGLNIKKSFPNTILIYILPPSLNVLNKRRGNRGDDRVSVDLEQMKFVDEYDYLIINDDIDKSYKQLLNIIKISFQSSIKNNANLLNDFYDSVVGLKKILK